jgi:hypothetical protein
MKILMDQVNRKLIRKKNEVLVIFLLGMMFILIISMYRMEISKMKSNISSSIIPLLIEC